MVITSNGVCYSFLFLSSSVLYVINLYVTLSIFSDLGNYIGKVENFLTCCLLPGIPPLPIFFTKVWTFSALSESPLFFLLISIALTNGPLVYSYLNYFINNKYSIGFKLFKVDYNKDWYSVFITTLVLISINPNSLVFH